jgi:taurine dioxygenase
MAAIQESITEQSITVTLLHPLIGAEVHGVDLRLPLRPEQRTLIRNLFIKHKVLFFRDQLIGRAQHLAFTRNFGVLQQFPEEASAPGFPEIHLVYSDRAPSGTNCWHTDGSFYEKPNLGTVLRAVQVPEVGGDTLFVDMAAAYRGLPDDIKQRIATLRAVHNEGKITRLDPNIKLYGVSEDQYISYAHPIVRTHPESGEKILYVNARNTTHIEGLSSFASDELLSYLLLQATVPEYQVRFQWKPNSIAFWDDRSTQHYGSADYGSAIRRMERVSLVGDKPY